MPYDYDETREIVPAQSIPAVAATGAQISSFEYIEEPGAPPRILIAWAELDGEGVVVWRGTTELDAAAVAAHLPLPLFGEVKGALYSYLAGAGYLPAGAVG